MKKSIVKVTAAGPDAGDRVKLVMSLAFDASSPTAPRVWKGLVLMLQEVLDPEELQEFVCQINRERAKLAKKVARPACLKCNGTGNVDRGNGSAKPCDCPAGIVERARRKTLADRKAIDGLRAPRKEPRPS